LEPTTTCSSVYSLFVKGAIEALGKRPSAALPSSLVTAAYFYVRLIPRDFGSLASGHFPIASEEAGFSTVSLDHKTPSLFVRKGVLVFSS
jgi:hypothetical protein